MADSERYDAAIIGSGQGGTPLASALAAKGWKTALIESRFVGGTCVNFGCTPTKTMVASARNAHMVSRSGDFGVRAGAGETDQVLVDMTRVRERKRAIVSSFREGSERRIEQAENLMLIRGQASFSGVRDHVFELSIKGEAGSNSQIAASKVFINTGTRTAIPEIEGIEAVPYLTNETVMELEVVPEHLIILGGGYIGVEFGQMFRRFGAHVTILQRGDRLLNREDADVSDAMAELLKGEGIELIFDVKPESVRYRDFITLTFSDRNGRREIEGTHLLVAAGRTPNTEVLNPAAAGISCDRRGYIRVNDRLETDVEGAWALGDVKGGPAFTHVSYDDYRILMKNLDGDGDATTAGRLLPYTVFTDPQLGRVGMTELDAAAAGRSVRVGRIPMSYVARALEVDETTGFMKAVVDAESDEILGFAMLGMEAGEIAGAVQLAMLGRLPAAVLRDGMFAHPTLMEALNTLFGSL